MSLASEVTTWQETVSPTADTEQVIVYRTRIRTNVGIDRLRRRLDELGLLVRAESIEHYTTNWHWSGTGHGYEILWTNTTTWTDLQSLASL